MTDGGLEPALDGARAVLFLCSGNMVRSAFADLYARHLGCPLPVSSAATLFRNDHIMEETARALEARGVPPAWTRAFRPRHLFDLVEDLDGSTLVLGMARRHLEPLSRRPELLRRAFLLAQLAGEAGEIQDPVLEGADFELTFRRIAACVEILVSRLRLGAPFRNPGDESGALARAGCVAPPPSIPPPIRVVGAPCQPGCGPPASSP